MRPLRALRSTPSLLALIALGAWACDDGSGAAQDPTLDAVSDPGPDATPDATGDDTPDGIADAIADAIPPDATPDAALPPCPAPMPPAEATRQVGPIGDDGAYLTPGGRIARPAGPSARVEGFPTSLAVDPGGRVAWITSASRDDRALVTVDLMTLEVRQTVARDEAHFGLAVAPDAEWVYASAGDAERIDRFPVNPDGTVGEPEGLAVDGYPSGIAVSADGRRLWVALFEGGALVEVDAEAWATTRRLDLPGALWDVVRVPGLDVLYVSDLAGESIRVVDPETWTVAAEIPAPTSPAGLEVDPDGARVWAAVSGADAILSIDPLTAAVVSWTPAAGDDWTDPDGLPLPNSNVNALAYAADTDRLYASRGADNAVSVFEASTMTLLGALPTAWYPTDVALVPGRHTLLTIEGKGRGAGPNDGEGVKERLAGSVTAVSLDGLDLAEATAQARAGYARPSTVFPYACDEGAFPIPTRAGMGSPIEHVILIVKENKTFDCVFGDLEGMDVDVDPSLVRWGEDFTPNAHALAREYCLLDNFYTEVANSDQGHIYLTSAHMTEYVERIWTEKTRTDRFGGYQITEPAIPDRGNVFSHLADHGVDLRIFGEIVGLFAPLAGGGSVVRLSDPTWPGGPATNYSVEDVVKARHFIARTIEADRLPAFSFVLLPNDHTNGTDPGRPTPESMVADNDLAMGLIIEALAASPYWRKSLVLVVQDDTQGCEDHVDGHRSFLLAVGPWVRRRHVSHVHGSFLSIFATLERIFGVPPIGRPDASAMPLWDCFTGEPDFTPYRARPRTFPPELNPDDAPGAAQSARMDWRSPDRNPGLGVILDSYRLYRMGRISEAEARRRIEAGPGDADDWDDAIEESIEETTAYDRDFARYQAWRAAQGLPPLEQFGRKALPEPMPPKPAMPDMPAMPSAEVHDE